METQRLKLQVVLPDDAEFLFKLMNTQKWYDFIGDRGIKTVDDARQYIMNKMHPKLSEKGFVNHLMIDKTTNKIVGTCSLHDRDGVDGMDIGYALLPEFEGKGYASEGAQAMISLAFNVHQQKRISAITSDDNKQSYGLLEKLGFTQNGYIKLPNSDESIRLYILEK